MRSSVIFIALVIAVLALGCSAMPRGGGRGGRRGGPKGGRDRDRPDQTEESVTTEEDTETRCTRAECVQSCVREAVPPPRRGGKPNEATKPRGRGLGREGAQALVQCIQECDNGSRSGLVDDEEDTETRSTRAECVQSCVREAVPPPRRGGRPNEATKPMGRGLGREGAQALVQCIQECDNGSGSGSGSADDTTPEVDADTTLEVVIEGQ